MGERKGQNKYYPPDFDYKVHKSLAGYHGQHPLRERARKMDQGILIIRFEMPYNIWCDDCNNHIGMGVRYNAEKSKMGMYYTTPIYKFRMKCHLCNNHFEIKTDPGNHDYVIISGARRKEQRWDPKENEQIVPEDRECQKKLATDSMYKLEHGSDDVSKSKAAMPAIAQIVEHQASHRDDYTLNQLARKQFRETKAAQLAVQHKDDEVCKKFGLDVELVKEHPDDVHLAGLLQYSTVQSYDEKQREKRKLIESRPLFEPTAAAGLLSPSSASSSSSDSQKHFSLSKIREISTSELRKQRSHAFTSDTPHHKRSQSTQHLGIVRKKLKPSTDADTLHNASDDSQHRISNRNCPSDVDSVTENQLNSLDQTWTSQVVASLETVEPVTLQTTVVELGNHTESRTGNPLLCSYDSSSSDDNS